MSEEKACCGHAFSAKLVLLEAVALTLRGVEEDIGSRRWEAENRVIMRTSK
jgi:hypothetical protein